MSTPLVSIIIPCFNNEAYVGEAVESALGQTYPSIEVLVVNDGSTDGSLEILSTFEPRIRLYSTANQGACAARNIGLQHARGEWVQFLDADDKLYPQKIARQVAAIQASTHPAITCYGDLFGDENELRAKKAEREILPSLEEDSLAVCINNGLGTEGPLIPRSYLEKISGFRQLPRAQEYDLHVRLAAAGCSFGLLKETLYAHRNHDKPRISTQIVPTGEVLQIHLDLIKILDESPEAFSHFTPRHRALLAQRIMNFSKSAGREGKSRLAIEGIRAARRHYPDVPYSDHKAVQSTARLIGYENFEFLHQRIRYARDSVKRLSTRLVSPR